MEDTQTRRGNLMKLSIDTSTLKEVTVSLEENEVVLLRSSVPNRRTQDVLPFIDELLHEKGKTVHALTSIAVAVGPGSYTGLRVGIAIANTLGTLLKIPINDLKIGQLVKPMYS